MNDIVERLRLMLACDPDCEGRCMDCPTSVARDAADEILRLRAERAELRQLLVGLGAGIPAAAILRAEDRCD